MVTLESPHLPPEIPNKPLVVGDPDLALFSQLSELGRIVESRPMAGWGIPGRSPGLLL